MAAVSRLQDETDEETPPKWKKRAESHHADRASDPGRDWVARFSDSTGTETDD